jgi:hypothetical protein
MIDEFVTSGQPSVKRPLVELVDNLVEVWPLHDGPRVDFQNNSAQEVQNLFSRARNGLLDIGFLFGPRIQSTDAVTVTDCQTRYGFFNLIQTSRQGMIDQLSALFKQTNDAERSRTLKTLLGMVNPVEGNTLLGVVLPIPLERELRLALDNGVPMVLSMGNGLIGDSEPNGQLPHPSIHWKRHISGKNIDTCSVWNMSEKRTIQRIQEMPITSLRS